MTAYPGGEELCQGLNGMIFERCVTWYCCRPLFNSRNKESKGKTKGKRWCFVLPARELLFESQCYFRVGKGE